MFLGCFCCSGQCVNFDVVSTSSNTIEFNGLVNCGATTPSSVIFNPMSTKTDFCVNDYLDLGYFYITQGIADIESLDFTFNECGCTGICCSNYYIYSTIDQSVTYTDCLSNGAVLSIKARTATFICAKEIVGSATLLVTKITDCQCCETECYNIHVTNYSSNSITITATNTTCFGLPKTILAGTAMNICVSELITLDYSGLGNPLNLSILSTICECLPT